MAASGASSVANRAATAAVVVVLLVVAVVITVSNDLSRTESTATYGNVAAQNDPSGSRYRSESQDNISSEQPDSDPSAEVQLSPGLTDDGNAVQESAGDRNQLPDTSANTIADAAHSTPAGDDNRGDSSDTREGPATSNSPTKNAEASRGRQASSGQERPTSQRDRGPQVPPAASSSGKPASGAYVVSRHRVNGHMLDLTVYSPALGHTTGVRLLLPPGWNRNPARSWPTLYMMPGYHHYYSYNRGDWHDWTYFTDIEQFMKGRPVLTVLPSGGGSGFFTNWWNGGKRGTPKWETYHTQELPALLESLFGASSTHRAIAGISLGGYAAVEYAIDHPEMYDAVASYSGVLHTTYPGMPLVFKRMWADAGLKPKQIWGQPYPLQQRKIWKKNDPWHQAKRLCGQDINIYLSASSGLPGKYADASKMLSMLVRNPASYYNTYTLATLLEAGAMATTLSFETRLRTVCTVYNPFDAKGGLDIVSHYNSTGTHKWPYWQDMFRQSWSMLADSLGLQEPNAIEQHYAELGGSESALGQPVGSEHRTAGGRVQQYEHGRIYWSPSTGAHVVRGKILDRYLSLGGPGGVLGFPTTDERATPDGVGRYNHFAGSGGASIYWTPATGAHEIYGAIRDAWASLGWERSRLGYPTSGEYSIPRGRANNFQHGRIQWIPGSGSNVIYD